MLSPKMEECLSMSMTMTMTMTMIFYFFNGPFWGMEEIQLNSTYIMFNNDIHIENMFFKHTQKIFKSKKIFGSEQQTNEGKLKGIGLLLKINKNKP